MQGLLGVTGPTGQPTQVNLAPNKGKDVYPVDRNNFAPNVGFNWDPTGNGKFSISANYRIAYDRAMMATMLFQDYNNEGMKASRQIFPGGRFADWKQYIPLDPGKMFAPLPVGARQAQVITYQTDLSTPYTQAWSLRIQREIMHNTVLQVAYVGNHATKHLRGYNYNQVETVTNGFIDGFLAAQRNLAANGNPNIGESTGLFGKIMKPLGGIPASMNTWIAQGQVALAADQIDRTLDPTNHLLEQAGLPVSFFRLNPQFQHARAVSNLSNSNWNGLKIEITRRFYKGLHFGINYTFGKGLTDYVGGQAQSDDFRDNHNRKLDKRFANFDSPHVVNANYILELPVGQGRRWLANAHPLVKGMLGGWQINGLVAYATGQPFTIHSGRYNLTTGDYSTADYSGNGFGITKVIKGDQIRLISEADKSLFRNPRAGSAGSLSQYAFRGDDVLLADASLMKSFPLRHLSEQGELQFRFEIYNFINQTNFTGISTDINAGDFGVLTSAREPRVLQFALRLQF